MTAVVVTVASRVASVVRDDRRQGGNRRQGQGGYNRDNRGQQNGERRQGGYGQRPAGQGGYKRPAAPAKEGGND